MVVVTRKLSIGQWVQCPITGELGQAKSLPYLVNTDDGVDTYVVVEYPDGWYAVRLIDIIL